MPTAPMRPGWIAALCAALAVLFWGSSFAAVRLTLRHFEPGPATVLRFVTASLVLAVYLAIRREPLPRLRDWPLITLLGFLGFTYNNLILTYGLVTVTAGSATFLVGTMSIFSAIIGQAAFGERLRPIAWLGITVSLTGVATIAMAEGQGSSVNLGALMMMSGIFAQSINYVFQRPLLRRYSPLQFTGWAMIIGTVGMLPWGRGVWPQLLTAPPDVLLALLYLGILPTAVAHLLWSAALARASAYQVASAVYAMPLVGIATGWLLLGELPPLAALVGGCTALAGVLLVNWRGRRG